MKPLQSFKNAGIEYLFTDIDDTLTDHGQLGPEAYEALWELERSGVRIIPVTGRPAGWCEMIARFWPVAAVVGENGGFYFRYVKLQMKRRFFCDETTREANRKKLEVVREKILQSVPGCQIASDQFSRLMDLAVDFAEDVHPTLSKDKIDQIVKVFTDSGAQAKVSSIHVNGWFGEYDKLSMCRTLMREEFGIDLDKENSRCAFVGDSPNDEPMFGFFKNSFAVANIQNFLDRITQKPKFVAPSTGGQGFVQIKEAMLGKAF